MYNMSTELHTYSQLKSQIRTFDVIAIKGAGLSDFPVYIAYKISDRPADFTHVLFCIQGSSFPKESVHYHPDRLYALESNIDTGGVVLIELENRLNILALRSNVISWCRLQELIELEPERLEKLVVEFTAYEYDVNPIIGAATVIPLWRLVRDNIIYPLRKATHAKPSINCSGLVAQIMYNLGKIDDSISIADVLPIDLILLEKSSENKERSFPALWNVPIPFTLT
jgi:hypothetical protein